MAVHGHDHRRRSVVTSDQMRRSLETFGADAYIPPFNEYRRATIDNWEDAGGSYFFGGFHGEHHSHGHWPTMVKGVLHIPASEPLYGRAAEVASVVDDWNDPDVPRVVTLHVPWEAGEKLRPLIDRIATDIVPPSWAAEWLHRATPDLKKLKAANWLAYSWVVKRLCDSHGKYNRTRVLDFGSRYSALPSLIRLRGFDVRCFDRDQRVEEYQAGVAKEYGVSRIGFVADIAGRYDAITACWSVQHNEPQEMARIMGQLSGALADDGHVLFVGSYSQNDPRHQTDRADPQWILDDAGYSRYIVDPGQFVVADRSYFRYSHNTLQGEHCDACDANAICLQLRKTQR